MSDAVRTIKKYPNRRLYDTANSGYITLADVKQMVLDNIDFQVVDAKTGDDLTRAILLQIILDEEGGGVPMFSSEMLALMIRFYGSAQQTIMGQYMEQNVKAFLAIQKKLQDQAKQVYGDKMMLTPDLWKQFMQMQAPAMQGMLGNYLEQSAKLFMDMQQRMQDQTRGMFTAFPFPELRCDAANRRRRRQEALNAKAAQHRALLRRNCCDALSACGQTSAVRLANYPPTTVTVANRVRPPSPPRVGFVSLGCPKALVDSEQILTQLRAEGYAIAPDYDGADLVVVNTCGFIDAAVAESLDAIGEALRRERQGHRHRLPRRQGRRRVRARGASQGARRHRPARHAGSDDARCTRTCRSRTIRSSTSCRRRGSSSRPRTTRI